MEDGRRVELAALAGLGYGARCDDLPGCARFHLPDGASAVFDVGGFGFVAKSIAAPRPLAPAPRLRLGNQAFGGASLAFHFLVVCIAFFDVPNLLAMSLDFADAFDDGVKYAPLEMHKKEVVEKKADDAGAGKRHADEEGQMGKRDAPRTNNKYALKRTKDDPTPRLAKEMAREVGILGYLKAASAPMSPFGETPNGQDPENALGALNGDRFGENFGYGGLGIHGTGRGGGGDGSGTIGVGDLDTIGRDKYGRDKGGPDIGDPNRRRPPVHHGPTVRDTGAMVHGSLSKDAIRRVVHRHLNEVKFCYERELASRPDLTGRVSVQFVINGMGGVQTAVTKDSTLGSAALDACIAQAVRRWTFPQPDGGGVVIVTYPFQLETPAD
jgi:TonB family protein